jgi:hypothetical protein
MPLAKSVLQSATGDLSDKSSAMNFSPAVQHKQLALR